MHLFCRMAPPHPNTDITVIIIPNTIINELIEPTEVKPVGKNLNN